jgi:hypothetical protein
MRSGEIPIFRHPDDLFYASQIAETLGRPRDVSVWPVITTNHPWYANPHIHWSAWPILRVAELLGINDANRLFHFFRWSCRVLLAICGAFVTREILLGLGIERGSVIPCALLLGAYLALEPGLAHLKPFLGNLAGKGNNGNYVGFDRPVSPSSDVLFFVLALWAGFRTLRLPSASSISHMARGFLLSLPLLVPPWFPFTFAVAAAVILFALLLASPDRNATMKKFLAWLREGSLWFLLGALPVLVFCLIKAKALADLGVTREFLDRSGCHAMRQLDFRLLTRSTLIVVALSLCGLVWWKWDRSRSLWLSLPLLWLVIALVAWNHAFLLGINLLNVHFQAPLGILLGLAIITTALWVFRRRPLIPAISLWALSATCLLAIAKKSQRELAITLEQRQDFAPILPSTFLTASRLIEEIRPSNTPTAFIAPDSIELPIQFLAGWRQIHSFYMVMFPYSDEELWRSYVIYSALTGSPVEETFSTAHFPASTEDILDDNSSWFYGLPPGVEAPLMWVASARRKFLPIVQEAARRELMKPFHYDGPFPLVVIRRSDWPLPNYDHAPDKRVSTDGWEAWVWTTPFTIAGRQ